MTKQKILVMGLPGSGKTTLAEALTNFLRDHNRTVEWFNADDVRKRFNDWDFSEEGRIRQSLRMSELASESTSEFVICDFIAPLPEMRKNFKPNWIIWLDTIKECDYADTNRMFVSPARYDFRIIDKDAETWVLEIGEAILMNKHTEKTLRCQNHLYIWLDQ